MTLTVRLDQAIEAALERHCADRGVTKSAVVQESLAAYLWGKGGATGTRDAGPSAGPIYHAFEHVGFIGAAELGGVSADKAALRKIAVRRIRRTHRK